MKKHEELEKDLRRKTNDYAKYSSLAFQMGFTIIIITFAGYGLDLLLKNEFKIFTIIFCSKRLVE